MKEEHRWGWPVASYLFLGGLGGGMIALAGLSDLVFGRGEAFSLGSLIGGIAIAVGSALLVFELGRPFQFWRVLSRQKAIMTAGAWMLSSHDLYELCLFLLLAGLFPLAAACRSAAPRCRDKHRPWPGRLHLHRHPPGEPEDPCVLEHADPSGPLPDFRSFYRRSRPIAPAGAWPYRGSAVDVEAVHAALRSLDLTLIVFELMVLFLYVLMMRLAAGKVTARIAATWLAGQKSFAFWGVLSSSVWRRRVCSTWSLPRRLTLQRRSSCSSGG